MNTQGGEGLRDSFGSEILVKRDFLRSTKDAGGLGGGEKNTGINFGYCTFHQLKSTIT